MKLRSISALMLTAVIYTACSESGPESEEPPVVPEIPSNPENPPSPSDPGNPEIPEIDVSGHKHVALSPKLNSGNANPLSDAIFCADPTAIEHDGRLYVYATSDHQQYETVGKNGENNYGHIKRLEVFSTDDMVNWTYHGSIPVGDIASHAYNSWAPSIVSRKEADGKTHFYMYYSDNGIGVGVITATSPTGPWSDPLRRDLVDFNTPEINGCKVPFDPGVVIDENGIGWLSFGGGEGPSDLQPGNARIVRLGKDLLSFDSECVTIDAPYFFEASELNYINGTWVYTYNNSWKERIEWPYYAEKPTGCSMAYMTTKTPLVRESWEYRHHYLKNPGDYGYTYSNNHTHLHKFNDKWYIFYHTLELQKHYSTTGGFRNVCVDEITVDEANVDIKMGRQTTEGVSQIKMLNPFTVQQAETMAASQCLSFEPTTTAGNMLVRPAKEMGVILVRGVAFDKTPKQITSFAKGRGVIELRLNDPEGKLIATLGVTSTYFKQHLADIDTELPRNCNLCFVIKGETLMFDTWQFK